MRRLLIVVASVSVLGLVSVTVAQAQSPHFVTPPNCVQTNSTTLSCSGKVAGLGSANIFVVVNAPAGCTVQSGANNPPGQQNFISGPFTTPNGNFTFGPTTDNIVNATAGGCPGTQTAFIENENVTVSVFECTSGSPTFNRKTGAQTNRNCTLDVGPTPA
jgi:hypothetical protein